jgi:hypothetical protein
MAPVREIPVTASDSVASAFGQVPQPGRASRHRISAVARWLRWQTTPDRIRGLAAVTIIVAVLLGLITAVIFMSVASGLQLIGRKYSVNPWDLDLHPAAELRKRPRTPRDDRILTIGQQSEPEVLATTDLYFRLSHMDAQVANVLLVGPQRGLGIDRQQAQALYEQDRIQADQDLQRAAVVAGSVPSAQSPVRAVLDGLGRYEALAGEGQQDMSGWTGVIPAAGVLLITVLVLAGVRPRLAEYR